MTSLERSEKMSLCSQEPQTDQRTTETEERLLNLGKSIEATPQTTKRMQPGDGPLHIPAELTQPAAMLGIALAQHRRDPQPTQQHAQRLRIVAGVALQSLR